MSDSVDRWAFPSRPAWVALDDASRTASCVRCGVDLPPLSDEEPSRDWAARVFRAHAGCAVDQWERNAAAEARRSAIARSTYAGDRGEQARIQRTTNLVAPGASALTRGGGVVGATVAQAEAMTRAGSHSARVAAARAHDGSVPIGMLSYLFGSLGARLGEMARSGAPRDHREAAASGALGIAAAELLDLIGGPDAPAPARVGYRKEYVLNRGPVATHDIDSGGAPLSLRRQATGVYGATLPRDVDLSSLRGGPVEIEVRNGSDRAVRFEGAIYSERTERMIEDPSRPLGMGPDAEDLAAFRIAEQIRMRSPGYIPRHTFEGAVPVRPAPPLAPPPPDLDRLRMISHRDQVSAADRRIISMAVMMPFVATRLHMPESVACNFLVSAKCGLVELFRDLPGELMCGPGGIALPGGGGMVAGVRLYPAVPLMLEVENISMASCRVVLTMFGEYLEEMGMGARMEAEAEARARAEEERRRSTSICPTCRWDTSPPHGSHATTCPHRESRSWARETERREAERREENERALARAAAHRERCASVAAGPARAGRVGIANEEYETNDLRERPMADKPNDKEPYR